MRARKRSSKTRGRASSKGKRPKNRKNKQKQNVDNGGCILDLPVAFDTEILRQLRDACSWVAPSRYALADPRLSRYEDRFSYALVSSPYHQAGEVEVPAPPLPFGFSALIDSPLAISSPAHDLYPFLCPFSLFESTPTLSLP